MRKTIIFLLAWLAIYSCRPESEMIKQNNDKTASKKFRVFSKDNSTAKGNNAIDYSKAFAYLAQRYDSLNHKNITGLVNSLNKVHYNKTLKQNYISKYSEAYLEFRLHSQTVFEENGQIWVLYPKIDQNRVVDLVVAILSENETKVYFQTISRRSELFARSIGTFQGNYDKYFRTDENGNVYFIAHTSRCGFEGEIPCEIPEIIISPPPKNGGGYTGELPGGGDNPPSGGGCEIYMECEPDGEEMGGGSSSNNQQTNDPCAKAKKLQSSQQLKAAITELKEKSKIGGEKGVKIKADGTTSAIINGGAHYVKFGDMSGYYGSYHNHTPTGIKMFSVRDIYNLFTQIISLPKGVDSSEAFGGMIASEICNSCEGGYRFHNYVMRFSGTGQEAGNIYTKNYNFEQLLRDYQKHELNLSKNAEFSDNKGISLNAKGLEELFFKSLDLMGIDKNKVTLQRIDAEGNIININIDNNGDTKTVPCS